MDFTRSRLPGVFAAQSVLSSQTGLEWGIFSNPRQRQPHEQHPSVVMPSFVSIMSIYLRLHERPDFLSPKHMLINMYWSGNKPVIGVGHHFRVYGCPLSALNLAPDKGLGNVPTGTEVLCIKVPNRSHETNRHDLYQAVLRELRVLCHPSLSNHENIISLLGFDFEQDYDDPQVAWPVLVMECSEYGTLHDFQQNSKDMTPDLLRRLLLDVALGLDTLHQCNIIHGDMKSENVLICRNGCRNFVAKLSDFGLAVINPAVDDVHFLPGGTWLWSAPEAKQGLSIMGLALTDVYSLGLMVWRSLLSEANPFDLLRSEHGNVHGALGLEEFVTQAKLGEDFPEFAVWTILSSARKDMAMSYGGKVIRSTVCKDPANRDLKAAISALSNEDGYVLKSLQP